MAKLSEKQRIFFTIVGSLIAAILVFGGFVFYAVNLIQDYIEEITPTEPYKPQTKKYTDAGIKEYIDTQYGEIGGGGGTVISTGGFVVPNTIGYDADTATNTTLSLIEPDWTFGIGTTTTITPEGFFTLAVYGSSTVQTPINTTNAFRIQNAATSTVFNVNTIDGSATLSGALTVGSCSGCTAPSFGFPWDSSALGNATSTLIILDGGFISSASSTISSTLDVTSTTTIQEHLTLGTTTPHESAMFNIEIDEIFEHGIKITGSVGQDEHLFSIENNAGVELFNILANGEVDLVHTATGNNEISLSLNVDAAGFGEVVPIFINFDVGDLAAGEDETALILNFDVFDTTGGDVHGIGCFSSTGSANKHCLQVGAGLAVFEQLVGTFGNVGVASTTAGGIVTTEFNSTGSDVTLFASNNDVVVVGDASKFEEIEFVLDTIASGAGVKPTFEFSSGVTSGVTDYTSFFPTDTTNGFRNFTGEIAFEETDIPAWVVGADNNFLIRITRTQGGLDTVPIEDIVQISAVTVRSWDFEGDAHASAIFASSTMIVDGLVTAKGGFISTASSTVSAQFHVSNIITGSSTITIDGESIFNANATIGNAATDILTITSNASTTNSLTIGLDLFTDGVSIFTGLTTQIGGFISSASSTISSNLHISGGVFNASSTAAINILSIDATGALVIPQGTNPTVDSAGEIAMDTSATGQLVVHDGSVVSVYRPDGRLKAGLVATSTLTIKGAYSATGTTTIIIAGYDVAITLQSIRCLTDPLLSSNGTTTMRIGDGTNFTETAECDDRTNGISTTLSSNVTFTAGEEIHIEIGGERSNPDYISFDIPWLYTRI